MRAEIARLQRDLAVTTMYVTHDQVEAMTMGDRVAVLKDGYLQQVDTPQNLYDRPDNVFVGAFIGSPSMNLFESSLSGSTLSLGSQSVTLPDEVFSARPALRGYEGKNVILGIRPEDFDDAALVDDVPADRRITAKVVLVEALGSELVVHFGLDAPRVDSGDPDAIDEVGDADSNTVGRFGPRSRAHPGESIEMVINTANLHFFDLDSRTSIWS
jgi:multiple sugar transport system ATP-binding protein